MFSAADYMDTYYRLLRAEMYSAIQKGIHELKSGVVKYFFANTLA